MSFIKFVGKVLLALLLFVLAGFVSWHVAGFVCWYVWKFIVAFLTHVIGIPMHQISV